MKYVKSDELNLKLKPEIEVKTLENWISVDEWIWIKDKENLRSWEILNCLTSNVNYILKCISKWKCLEMVL